MNIIDLRKGPRRASIAQRNEERRKVLHEFGSPEWLKYIKDNELDRPKIDRRKSEKSIEKRQLSDRREQQPTQPDDSMKKHVRVFLTPGERNIIEDLYLSDL